MIIIIITLIVTCISVGIGMEELELEDGISSVRKY